MKRLRMSGSTWRSAATGTALAATAAMLMLTGCASNSTGPSDSDDAVRYRLRTSPNNVLYNLNLAYVEMDAEGYLDCLAEDFEFILNPDDVNNPENPLPECWGKQEERDIHERMFSDTTNVDSVDLTLTNMSIYYDQGADPGDPNDDRFTYYEGSDLRVAIGDWTFVATADQEFVFMIDPDETGPNGETLWEIVEWYDIRPPERVQNCTWGSVKSFYR